MERAVSPSYNLKGTSMCEPTTIALVTTAVVTIVATSVSTTMAVQAANAQEKAGKAKAKNAKIADGIRQGQLKLRGVQEAEKADLAKRALTDQAALAESMATVSLDEGGVGGQTSLAIAREIKRSKLSGIAAIDRNADATQLQLATEQQGSRAAAAREIAGINAGPNAGLAGAAAALGGISSGVGLATSARSLSSKAT